jgi:hypothetical protein
MARSKRGRGQGPAQGGEAKKRRLKRDHADVYEAEDNEPEEERLAGRRYDVRKSFRL